MNKRDMIRSQIEYPWAIRVLPWVEPTQRLLTILAITEDQSADRAKNFPSNPSVWMVDWCDREERWRKSPSDIRPS
jgi:hypothetical protein